MSVFLVYWQLSQGQIDDFPAILGQSFKSKLWKGIVTYSINIIAGISISIMATVLTGIILGATTGSKKIINNTTEMDYVENSKYSVSQTFGKLGYFWLFLSAPVQAISVNNPQFFAAAGCCQC